MALLGRGEAGWYMSCDGLSSLAKGMRRGRKGRSMHDGCRPKCEEKQACSGLLAYQRLLRFILLYSLQKTGSQKRPGALRANSLSSVTCVRFLPS